MKKGLLVVLMLVVVVSMLTGCLCSKKIVVPTVSNETLAKAAAEGYLKGLKNASLTEMEKYLTDSTTFVVVNNGITDTYTKEVFMENWSGLFSYYQDFTTFEILYAIETTTKVDSDNYIVAGEYSVYLEISEGEYFYSNKLNSDFEFTISKVNAKWLIANSNENWVTEEMESM